MGMEDKEDFIENGIFCVRMKTEKRKHIVFMLICLIMMEILQGNYDFYLIIRIHDYRLEQLSEEEQENVINSLANIEKRLLETYGENASFEILHAEYTVKYADGVKL